MIFGASESAIRRNSPSKYPDVDVPTYAKDGSSRKYDKRQCCMFCMKKVVKIEKHLTACHSAESDVQKLSCLSGPVRVEEIGRLRRLGNFKHNIEVLASKKGSLLVARRPRIPRRADEYLPCRCCLDFIFIEELWRHNRLCPAQKGDMSETNERQVVRQSTILLESAISPNTTAEFHRLFEVVIAKMKLDDITSIVKHDSLILKFGSIQIRKLGPERRNHISGRLRQLARLLQVLRGADGSGCLMDYIDGGHFDDVVQATADLCGNDSDVTLRGVEKLRTPSIGLHLGNSLQKCASIKEGIALRSGDEVALQRTRAFSTLLKNEWHDTISSISLQTLQDRRYRYSTIDLVPLCSDVKNLSTFLQTSIEALVLQLEAEPSPDLWHKLRDYVYCAITLFNFRRAGEMATMKLVSYQTTYLPSDEDLYLNSLSPLEKELVKRLDVLYIPGKRNRKVPVLFRTHEKKAMDSLIKYRADCGVDSIYFFANAKGYINGFQALIKAAAAAGCERPELITTTRLRKFAATAIQVCNLNDGELLWVANHLGHSIDIHKDVYRLHSSTVERAKVSKLLLAAERGAIGNVAGKTLEEIDLEDLEVEPAEPCGSRRADDGRQSEPQSKRQNGGEKSTEKEKSKSQAKGKRKVVKGKGSNGQAREEVDIEHLEVESAEPCAARTADEDRQSEPPSKRLNKGETLLTTEKPNGRTKGRREVVKRKWSDDELKAVGNCFNKNIKRKLVPGLDQIRHVMERTPTLSLRTPAQIKAKCQHLISKA